MRKARLRARSSRKLSAPKRLRIAQARAITFTCRWPTKEAICTSPADGCAFRCRESFMWASESVRTTKMLSRRRSFSNVELTQPLSARRGKPLLTARLKPSRSTPPTGASSILRRTLRSSQLDARRHALIFNRNGHIERLPVAGGKPRDHRHRVRESLQQRSRHFAGLQRSWRSATTRRADSRFAASTLCRSPEARRTA